MTKIVVYDDDEREFVSDEVPHCSHTRNVYQAKKFNNVVEAERFLSENLPVGSFTFLETVEV
jgi:hypothetical protein